MIKESKTLDKSYLRDYKQKDLQNIKILMCYMKYKQYLDTELHIEHFLGLIRYFSINFDLNVTIFISYDQEYRTNCQIISINGTNVENLMFFYKELLNKTELVEPLIKENIKNGQLHSFTTILDQETYSFDLNDGKNIGKHGCLVLSCNHFIGYKSLNEWFENFMNKCPYCRSNAVPLFYFESQLYLVDN